MRRFKKQLSGQPRTLLLTALCLGVAAAASACSQRVVKNPMKVGETVTMMPIKSEAIALTQKPKHVRLVFDIGGKMLSPHDDVQILMFESEASATPRLSASAKDLSLAHQQTNCPTDVYAATRDAMVGDVLFCNESLNVESLKHFVAKREGKDPKIGTNALLEFEDPASGLASYIISFH